MSFYSNLAEILQEKIALFKSAELHKEAELLQARLDALAKKTEKTENISAIAQKVQTKNPMVEIARNNLRVIAAKHNIPELERQYILENVGKANCLKELERLRVSCINRMLKISRANRSEKVEFVFNEPDCAGPYNNEKTFSEALQLIYSQDPLWLEDLKELYFSIMPLSSAAAISKSPL
ncbi:MAG: hypothetical protein LBU89_15160 [Fibromonadaceae bacterium]|jgi:hypothetical protein|nr:hypothetical protein [Fibromonadaceae bacterium]